MLYTIKKEASAFRNRLGIGNTEPIRLTSLLLKLNVITIFRDLSDGFSGMSVMALDKKFMLVNSAHSIGRQHFTICHELYHLYFDKEFTPHACNTGVFNKTNEREYFADIFASYFLMPDDGIINLIPDSELGKDKLQPETILKIEQYFSCSRASLLYRLKELNQITSKTYDRYCHNIKNTARQYGYPVKLYEKGNGGLVIGDFGTIAKQLFDMEKISEGHYVSLMRDIGIDVFNNSTDGDSN
jgi:Zn-dependent peptidase ImmA (M78 family)